ncbi:chemotaxis protein CheW [Clostridium faecium]|uniref:Chemotaxis protein CheA n=1 Tax=Clostridium faecium TaxID=2762223 RepID=A0ABR8YPA8_9CLOT|nr:chemotaxis protein CheW [Clostridium faecium]MBD8045972.1 chemotaxis protein CheW [Clostridium faecium]
MDTSQYLSMFLEESMDNLQTLNECLLILEQEPNDKEKLNEIFRVAHTIKGMAATMGYNTIAELTHKMEDVLSNFREGKLNVTPKVVTVLFKCLDTLENMIDNIAEDNDEEVEIHEIVEALEEIAKGHEIEETVEEPIAASTPDKVEAASALEGIELNEYDIDVIKEARNKGFNSYNIHISLDSGTMLKSARAFIIIKNLEEHGEVIKSLPVLEDLEAENFDCDIDFVYLTKKSMEEVNEILNGISEINSIDVYNTEADKIVKIKEEYTELNEYDISVIKQAKDSGFNAYNVHVVLDEGTILKSARSFIIIQNLEEHGEIIKTIPVLEDLETENFDLDIQLAYLTKKSKDEIEEVLNRISEISEIRISNIELENINKEEKSIENKGINTENNSKKTAIEPKDIAKNNKPKKKEENKKQSTKNGEKSSHEKTGKSRTVGQSVRVDLEKLDKFMNMVSELVIHRTRLEQISLSHRIPELNETLEQVARSTSDLQDLVMKIRMLPLDVVFNRFPRMIRDLALELNKEIELEILGQDTELDRTVIEEIGEPLIHLLRNAADHGIESPEERISAGKNPQGKIRLIAYSEGTKAVIKVEDDGKGLNVEKIREKAERVGINTEGMSELDIKNLIFSQGFSTNEQVTDISGRGVGMDVVKTKISTLGGTVDAVSELEKGTSFVIRLPLTLQIIQALLVKVGSETIAISLGYIDRVIEYRESLVKKTNNKEVIIYNDTVINLIRVNEKLCLEDEDHGKKYIVMANIGEKQVGLLVDSLLGQQEIVIKPFGKTLKSMKEYIGATILGDGLVTLILDVASLV